MIRRLRQAPWQLQAITIGIAAAVLWAVLQVAALFLGVGTSSGLAAILFLAGLWGLFWLWTLHWVYEDAAARDWPALAIAAACFFTWPWGVLVYWLVVREREQPGTAPLS